MPQVGTYSFADFVASIVGPGLSASLGFDAAVAEEGVTIAPTEDRNNMTVGSDGSVMHTLRMGTSGLVTVRLLKTSDQNQLLMAGYNLQQSTSALWGKNALTLRNKSSGDTILCVGAAFRKLPDLTYAKDGGVNEWQFDAARITMSLGIY